MGSYGSATLYYGIELSESAIASLYKRPLPDSDEYDDFDWDDCEDEYELAEEFIQQYPLLSLETTGNLDWDENPFLLVIKSSEIKTYDVVLRLDTDALIDDFTVGEHLQLLTAAAALGATDTTPCWLLSWYYG